MFLPESHHLLHLPGVIVRVSHDVQPVRHLRRLLHVALTREEVRQVRVAVRLATGLGDEVVSEEVVDCSRPVVERRGLLPLPGHGVQAGALERDGALGGVREEHADALRLAEPLEQSDDLPEHRHTGVELANRDGVLPADAHYPVEVLHGNLDVEQDLTVGERGLDAGVNAREQVGFVLRQVGDAVGALSGNLRRASDHRRGNFLRRMRPVDEGASAPAKRPRAGAEARAGYRASGARRVHVGARDASGTHSCRGACAERETGANPPGRFWQPIKSVGNPKIEAVL